MKQIIILLAIFSLISCEKHAIKIFAEALLQSASGHHMNETCMDDTFTKNMQTLKDYADKANTLGVMSTCVSIYSDLAADNKCTNDLEAAKATAQIIIEKVKSPTFISELIAKGYDTLDVLVHEHANPNKTPETVGKAIGEAINILFQTKQTTVNLPTISLKEDELIWKIVEGLTTGLAEEDSEYLCRDTCLEYKEDLTELVNKAIEMAKEGKSIAEIIAALMIDIMLIPGFLGNCRLLELVAAITAITTDEGLQKMLERISEGVPQILDYIADAIVKAADKDFVGMTAAFGKILKIVLDFYVN